MRNKEKDYTLVFFSLENDCRSLCGRYKCPNKNGVVCVESCYQVGYYAVAKHFLEEEKEEEER